VRQGPQHAAAKRRTLARAAHRPPPAAVLTAAHHITPNTAGAGATPPLTLHPRVEASLPGGVRATSADQVAAVLDAYRALLAGVELEVYDVVVSEDKVRAGRLVVVYVCSVMYREDGARVHQLACQIR
jgi:hypothetical protein